jgi:hypothetical protein
MATKENKPVDTRIKQTRQGYAVPRCYSACNIDPLSRGIGVQN